MNGKWIRGIAEGWAARLIQHEIDHTNGVLFMDKATTIMTMDEYRKMRAEKMAASNARKGLSSAE